jgi:hypothetical protein
VRGSLAFAGRLHSRAADILGSVIVCIVPLQEDAAS